LDDLRSRLETALFYRTIIEGIILSILKLLNYPVSNE